MTPFSAVKWDNRSDRTTWPHVMKSGELVITDHGLQRVYTEHQDGGFNARCIVVQLGDVAQRVQVKQELVSPAVVYAAVDEAYRILWARYFRIHDREPKVVCP